MAREKAAAIAWGLLFTIVLAALIVVGSRNLEHFDAALVGYTFATLFAVFGITYRYAMWLQRPPTRMYWRRGWQVFLNPKSIGGNVIEFLRRFFLEFAANRFIFRRGGLRGAAHWLIMWGCILAALITFPLVWGWIHFRTVPGTIELYRMYLFGFPVPPVFHVVSLFAFVVFHGIFDLRHQHPFGLRRLCPAELSHCGMIRASTPQRGVASPHSLQPANRGAPGRYIVSRRVTAKPAASIAEATGRVR